MHTDDVLRELATTQHRFVAIRQANELGLRREAVRHRIARGDWERVTSRVIGLVGAPTTDLAPLMLATLHHGPEAYVSSAPALAAWAVPGFDRREPHVVVRRTRARSSPVARVHSTTDLFDSQIACLQGVPIVTPIRAIFDIAGRAHPMKVERALDNAWSRRLITYALLQRTLAELADRGRPGIRLMRELAADRPASYRPPGSSTEARVNEILRRAGDRPLRRQIDVGSQTNWVGRIDLVDDDLPLSVEVQSELFHGSKLDRERDKERIAALRSAGHEVVEAWETDVWCRPSKIVADIRDARRRATRRRAA